MMKKIIFPVVALLLFNSVLKADVKQPGVIQKQFMITNIDQFPKYKFSYIYQGYHYDKGWQPNKPDTLNLENNLRYSAASKNGSQTPLLGYLKDSSFDPIMSTQTMGGQTNVGDNVEGLVEVFVINSIKNGVVNLKKVKVITIYKNGKEKTRKADAGFFAFVSGDNFMSGLSLVALCALVALLMVFVVKRKRTSWVAMST